jgi:molybdopterin molybdotransferase
VSAFIPGEGGGDRPIGLAEARQLVRRHIEPLESEEVPVLAALGRILSQEVLARVDSPSADVSLKDGYAVRSCDTARVSKQRPARLPVSGSRFAGQRCKGKTPPGTCVKITSGAVLPGGADAVVGVEHCTCTPEAIQVPEPVTAGLNVLARGTDIAAGEILGQPGDRLGPGRVGWLAAAGLARVPVHRLPTVSLVATGDEVVAPGAPLEPGQLYASNLVTLSAWLAAFGIRTTMRILPDRTGELSRELPRALEDHDVLLTSGGAWGSERDLVVRILDGLGWQKVFHRIRMGPGKAVGFGLLEGRPVFCLPGGPPSNEMAFLQVALPAILGLAGWRRAPFPTVSARLTEPVQGRLIDWTQFKRGRIFHEEGGGFRVTPYLPKSRLESMALADCLIAVPEGVVGWEAGQWVRVQVLTPSALLI